MMPAISPWSRASAIRTRTARISVPLKSGRPPAIRTRLRNTAGWDVTSTTPVAGADPTVGVVMGGSCPKRSSPRRRQGICFDNPQNYRFISPEHPKPGQTDTTEAAYKKLNETDMASSDANSGGSIGSLAAGMPMQGGTAMDFIERTAMDAQVVPARKSAASPRASRTRRLIRLRTSPIPSSSSPSSSAAVCPRGFITSRRAAMTLTPTSSPPSNGCSATSAIPSRRLWTI